MEKAKAAFDSSAVDALLHRHCERSVRILDGLQRYRMQLNTELVAALELANMLDIAECMLQSALQREESRGAHQRTDFTARDDTRFLNHALAYRDSDGSVRIER
jgi:fumarate reductase flavoprotein subunit